MWMNYYTEESLIIDFKLAENKKKICRISEF